MIIENLAKVVAVNKDQPKLYLRNLLKEVLQGYTLNFIYTSRYQEKLLFTGGTCLRFCFGLNRLSEDLDLDVEDPKTFDLRKFLADLEDYYAKSLQYDGLEIRVAGNGRQVFLKFPVLSEIGCAKNRSESNVLFLRLDIDPLSSSFYREENFLYSTPDFNFIIRGYSLADLFASKIAAVLGRKFACGRGDAVTFKGRDYYDLIWFMQKGCVPNYKRVQDITGIKTVEGVLEEVDEKVAAVEPGALKQDLLPLFENPQFVEDFSGRFKDLYFQLRSRLHLQL